MKIKTNRFTRQQYKKNMPYLIVLIILIPLVFLFIPFQIKKYSKIKEDIEKIESEIKQFNATAQIVNSFDAYAVDELYKTSQLLVPSQEKGLNVLASLEHLSISANIAGFVIVSYSNPFVSSRDGVLFISAEGVGSIDSFIDFLKMSNTGGGRFVTIKNIEMAGSEVSVKFVMNFYSKEVPKRKLQEKLTVSDENIAILKKFQEEMQSNYKPVDSLDFDTTQTQYKTNPQPFGS